MSIKLTWRENLWTPQTTSYTWDISHTLITLYHPYYPRPSALTEYLKEKLHKQHAKRLSCSHLAQVEPSIQPKRNTPPSSITHRAHNFTLVSYLMYIICLFYYSLDASYQFEMLICSVLGFNIASMKEHSLQSFLLNLIHNQGWDRTMTTHLLYFTAKFLHGVYQCQYSYVWLPSLTLL